METAFAPLIDENEPRPNPVYSLSAIAARAQSANAKSSLNPNFVPDSYTQLQNQLAEEGSGTSTLMHILAWGAALKGQPQMLAQIEESKRRTALGKAIIPHVQAFNDMANAGHFEEAAKYIDTVANSFGAKAPELVPYLQQMQAKLQKRQEGYNLLKAVVEKRRAEGQDDPSNVNYKTFKAMEKAEQRKDQFTETTMLAELARSQPHIQEIGGVLRLTNPMTTEVQSVVLPQVSKASEFNDYISQHIANRNKIIPNQIADIFNNLPTKDIDGKVISPGSDAAKQIKLEYSLLLPVKADIETAPTIPLDPAISLQALQRSGRLAVMRRVFNGPNEIEDILQGQMNRLTNQQIAVTTGTMEANRYLPQTSGNVILGVDPSDTTTFIKPQGPMTPNDIQRSGGKFREVSQDVYNKQIVPAFAGIQTLDEIPKILKASPLESKGDVLFGGAVQQLSRLLGYPISTRAQVREEARTRLNKAIEYAENILTNAPGASGHNNKDIEKFKQYASGSFISTKQLLDNVADIRNRLNQTLDRSGVPTIPEPSAQRAKPRTPQGAIAPLVPKGPLDVQKEYPAVDADVTKRIADTVKQGEKGGAVRIEAPTTPPAQTQEEINLQKARDAVNLKRQQKVR